MACHKQRGNLSDQKPFDKYNLLEYHLIYLHMAIKNKQGMTLLIIAVFCELKGEFVFLFKKKFLLNIYFVATIF